MRENIMDDNNNLCVRSKFKGWEAKRWDDYYSSSHVDDYVGEIGRCGVIAEILEGFSKRQPIILDVGCGIGNLCRFLRGQEGLGFYQGIDISNVAIKIARWRYPGFIFNCVGADEFSSSHNYDAIIFSGVLGYLLNYQAIIDKYLKILNSDGIVVILGYRGSNFDEAVLAYVDANFEKMLDIEIHSQLPTRMSWRIVTITEAKKKERR
jgi:2-polyprenyl-6-hydroxyphenyl methylase/3-demethylubiquinone-9 3-methyltransferase